eukprot:CAMPEP_0114583724 /NCGR_PEP_ID=MMETSP0125-20121206/7418_1 /TAXON_ID=485358 ORGANISM="Aristerostoma sp., Strain ATCC 50986" /NCGR_SAMPLE_ID=MMETSP0125 /ASSEMBLY_ACC=CAM_ASM_000245 /LENGTH=55 /DNA_ID=CAMNT_0001777389 /DNA_START=117 /DNA_END=284 /DNA_ORIENTATION=-
MKKDLNNNCFKHVALKNVMTLIVNSGANKLNDEDMIEITKKVSGFRNLKRVVLNL